MAKTSVELDGSLLAAAQVVLGTTSKRETITTALREVVSRDAHQHLVEWVSSGQSDLDDDDVMKEAWG